MCEVLPTPAGAALVFDFETALRQPHGGGHRLVDHLAQSAFVLRCDFGAPQAPPDVRPVHFWWCEPSVPPPLVRLLVLELLVSHHSKVFQKLGRPFTEVKVLGHFVCGVLPGVHCERPGQVPLEEPHAGHECLYGAGCPVVVFGRIPRFAICPPQVPKVNVVHLVLCVSWELCGQPNLASIPGHWCEVCLKAW